MRTVEQSLPRLSAARAPLTREIDVFDARGRAQRLSIPVERALALYVDKRELVTLMTLGQAPELLALGYLLNQGLVDDVREVESVSVDWSVGAAAVRTRGGVRSWAQRVERRTVTTGCGQGTVFGEWLERATASTLPPGPQVAQAELVALLDAARRHPSIHRAAGSVHGTALWRGGGFRLYVEDVGRHNAVDTLAGWMAMQREPRQGALLYTTGRLTSEIVLKAARMGLPVLVSRNGSTAMGQQLAVELGLTLIGRASGRRFVCYAGAERIAFDSAAMPD